MRRAIFSIVGLLIVGAGVVAFCYSIYSLGRIGTCASGGPYVSARPCPAGTGLTIALIPIAVFGGLLGLALYSAGVRWKRPSSIGLGLWMWSFAFIGASCSLAYAAWGPASHDVDGGGVELAAIILLVIFIPMGVIPLVIAALSGRGRSSVSAPPVRMMPVSGAPVAPRPTPAGSPRPGAPAAPPAGDIVTRLERLNELRESGAISPEEFDRLKAKILAGG